MRIQAIPLTSGPITGGLEEISGGYKYQKDPLWIPNDPRYQNEPGRVREPDAGARTKMQDRRQRFAEFTDLRARGVPVREAAGRIGVAWKTGRTYERERLAALASETGDTT